MLNFSELESEFFNLRMARCELSKLDDETENQLLHSSADNSIDVIRLKIDLSVEHFQHFINSLTIPSFYSGGITEFIVTQQNYDFSKVRQKLEFIKLTPEDKPLFKEVFYKTFSAHDIGYHTSPYLTPLISFQKEQDCLHTFYEQYISLVNHDIVVMKKENKLVGFSTFQITDDRVLVIPLAGIFPEFRSTGLYHELIESYLKYFERFEGFDKCIFSSRLDNYTARHLYSKFGFKLYGTKFNYILTPFLNYAASADAITLNSRHASEEPKDWILMNEAILKEYSTLHPHLVSFKQKTIIPILPGMANAVNINLIFKSLNKMLFICKWSSTEKLLQIAWLEYEYN